MFFSSLRRGTAIATLTLFACLNLWAETGNHAFLDVNYLPGEGQAGLAPATSDLEAVSGLAQTAANNFALIANEEGDTLLPGGVVCDSVEIDEGMMTVRFTVPEEVEAELLDMETCGAILRRLFAELAELNGIVILVRVTEEGEYLPIDDYLPPAPEVLHSMDSWCEPVPPPPAETSGMSPADAEGITGQGPVANSGQPQGALSGRTVYTYGGHGRTWRNSGDYWSYQRGLVNSMIEDHGNQDQVDFFVNYLFNAGATVVTFRPIGHQENMVVVDNGAATLAGTWSSSSSTHYWGADTYNYASSAATETHTATYTPNIPEEGFYPVYCWTRTGSDRINQLYRIRHTGGESQIRVNHRRVGTGWVWLGTYHFEAGSNASTGSVVISNLEEVGETGSVVIADAIQFGNGVGDISRGTVGVSGSHRENESTRYWIQRAMGVGHPDPTYIYDASATTDNQGDERDSWSAPPRMAAFMRRDDSQGFNGDIYLGWHSNASGGSARGSVGLITSSPTTNQAEYAALLSDEIDADGLIEDANWENVWNDRASSTYTGGYGEISSGSIGNEMCASIIEVAFHDNVEDAELLRDPKVRNVMGRACYQAIVRYFNTYDSNPLAFLPEPPIRVRAENDGSGDVVISWAAGPSGGAGGDAATGYVVYRSTNGLGFGNPVTTASTSTTISGLTPGDTVYFRVAATNAGGESMPSEVVAVKVTSSFYAPILIVNGYDRIDRNNNVTDESPTMAAQRLYLRQNNSYDYVREHAVAIDAAGYYFDSCANEAIINGDISLTDYDTVVWILGEESTADSTFDSTEQSSVSTYLSGGGNLFVSGAEIGWDLDRTTGPSTADRAFYNTELRADYAGDDGGSYEATGVGGTILAGIVMDFAPGDDNYNVDYPDQLSTSNGSVVAATYTDGGSGNAVVQYSGAYKLVNFGFPFETITSASVRNQVMAAALTFFGTPVPVELSVFTED